MRKIASFILGIVTELSFSLLVLLYALGLALILFLK